MADGRHDESTGTAPGHVSDRRDGILRVSQPAAEWLHTGWNGGRRVADAAYNITVPENWDCPDIRSYVVNRLERAGFDDEGPVLLTGVSMDHVRGARRQPVTVYATAGISNPAALPMHSTSEERTDSDRKRAACEPTESVTDPDDPPRPGTVNMLILVDRTLGDGALANLLAVAAEAKAATLLARTGFPGTTTDAITVGHDPTERPIPYSGSATSVGSATRACVREAVTASLRSRYDEPDQEIPESVHDAAHGIATDDRADVFELPE